MSMRVDLNADLGEGFGPWRMGDDAALLDIVTSANVACGFHAGDPSVMARTMLRAASRDVGIGAHPGFADLQGFGRRRQHLSAEELGQIVAYQLGATQGIARLAGTEVRHLKLHGALSNMAAEDADIARACYAAALRVDPGIILIAQAATAMEAVARALGAEWAGEIFADRAYCDDGTLVDRSQPGAVLHDAEEAADRMIRMLRQGAILTESGRRLPCRIDTICVHGDTPEAITMAATIRDRLSAGGIGIRRF